MSIHHDDDLATLDELDLEHVNGGAAADGMSMMLPMMMMMKNKHASASPPPPVAPAAPLMPKVIVNGVEQPPQSSADGTTSYST